MLIKVFSNVLEHPLEDKYKQVWNVWRRSTNRCGPGGVDKQVWAGVCAEGVDETTVCTRRCDVGVRLDGYWFGGR